MLSTGPFRTWPWQRKAIAGLLALQLPGLLAVFPAYAFSSAGGPGLRLFAVATAILALVAVWGVWRQTPWAPWALLAVVSAKLTIDLFAWATGLDRTLTPVSGLVLLALAALVLATGAPADSKVSPYQRAFYAAVIFFPAWVGTGGLFLPQASDQYLPFVVPPLHARFLGAMYIAGAVLMILSALSREWREVRISTLMLLIWTGILGGVSLLHLDAFDWSWRPTWFWWVAYIGFPLGALYVLITCRQPAASGPSAPAWVPLSVALTVFGSLGVLTGLVLLLAPGLAVHLWPWKVTPLLAQVYSAPFLAYGTGSLLAARLGDWSEVRIPLAATLTFTALGCLASFLHRALFDPAALSTWVWFAGFAGASLTLLAALVSGQRGAARANAGASP